MNRRKYENAYNTLGIPPSCDWPSVKNAYRTKVAFWHPDRFPENTPQQKEAENRIREINVAYQILETHYQINGFLPGDRSLQEQYAARNSAKSTAQPNSLWTIPTPVPINFRHVRRLAGVILIFSLAWALFPAPFSLDEGFSQSDAPYFSNDYTSSRAPAEDYARTKTAPSLKDHRYFGMGSTLGEVIDAQGPPSQTMEDMWFYGSSVVYFDHGRVTRWHNDPANPLKIKAPSEENVYDSPRLAY